MNERLAQCELEGKQRISRSLRRKDCTSGFCCGKRVKTKKRGRIQVKDDKLVIYDCVCCPSVEKNFPPACLSAWLCLFQAALYFAGEEHQRRVNRSEREGAGSAHPSSLHKAQFQLIHSFILEKEEGQKKKKKMSAQLGAGSSLARSHWSGHQKMWTLKKKNNSKILLFIKLSRPV